MDIRVGETLYRYLLRNGQFSIDEVIVERVESCWTYVRIKETNKRVNGPKPGCIGVIVVPATSVWLRERNDILAKELLIQYEQESIAALQKDINEFQERINRKKALIKMLEES